MRDSRQPDVRLPALPPSRAAEGPTEISWYVHLSGSHFLPMSWVKHLVSLSLFN